MPMYLTELAPTALRGSMGVMCPLGITFGVLLGQIMSMSQLLGMSSYQTTPARSLICATYFHTGTEDAWPYCLSIYIIIITLSAVAVPILPESPKYLYVVKNETQNAIRGRVYLIPRIKYGRLQFLSIVVLSRIREMNDEALAPEIHEMKIEQQDSESANQDSWSIGRVLADKTLLLPLLLVCSLQAGQQVSGINAVSTTAVTLSFK